MQTKLSALADSTDTLVTALNGVRHGVIIVGTDRCVLNVNSAAEELLRAEDGLCLRSGRIGAASTSTEQQLYGALHIALVGGRSGLRSGRSFSCRRPSGKRSYVIHIVPLHRTGTDETLRAARALVVVIDPEHHPEPSAALLRRLYGLTNGEAEVAVRIARGAGVRDIADELSVSYPTIRTHLQHVFDKTDTHRQGELVRLLLVLNP
jgi:DNA-binding CsgD family transcriptional regulator